MKLSIALRETLLEKITKNSSHLKFIRTEGQLVLSELIVAGSNKIKANVVCVYQKSSSYNSVNLLVLVLTASGGKYKFISAKNFVSDTV